MKPMALILMVGFAGVVGVMTPAVHAQSIVPLLVTTPAATSTDFTQHTELPAPITTLQQDVSTPGNVAATPSLEACTITRALIIGNRGTEVTCLQRRLISRGFLVADSASGFDGFTPSGYFGPLTQAAVQSFQSQQNIVSSGTPNTTGYGAVGPRTRNALSLVHDAVSPAAAVTDTAPTSSIYISERGRGKPSGPTPPPPTSLPLAPEVPLSVINSRRATSTWLYVLSPEKFANPLEALSELDADKNGRLNMEDYALWDGASTSWKTIYVQAGAAGQSGGEGTFAKPFILADGNEYTFNHLLRPLLDAGTNTEVVFLDGVYVNVRLQIIKPGTNGEEISLQDPVGTPQLVNGLPVYQKPTYRLASWCNASGENCRVPHADYTMGQQATGKLVLRADHTGKAVFWAKKFRRTHTNISTSALYISGGAFQARDYTYANFRTEHIKNVLVSGLVFQEYTNGIVVNRAENIVIKNNSIEGMGSADYTGATGEAIGVGGIIIGADSQVVLFKNNKISDTWNSVRSDLVGTVDAGVLALNHSVYHQHSADVIYMDNTFANASGSLFKFGLYPQKSGTAITGEYPTEAWRRRVFLLNNKIVQDKVFLRYKHALISQQVFSFVQENSMERSVPDGKESSSASGVVMQGNTFSKTSDALLNKMQFLRVELPTSHGGLLPGWFFGNNSITGVPDDQLMVGRVRGTSHEQLIDLQPLVSDPALYTAVKDSAHTQVVDHANALRTASNLVVNELKSPNSQRDQLMQSIITSGGIPGLDIP